MSHRINKVNRVIQEELAKLIQVEFKEDLITVTSIETAADLKNAKVWICAFSNENKVLSELKKKTPEFQRYLGKKLYLKNTPKLSFHFDRGNEKIARIEKILSSLKKTKKRADI